MRKVILENQFKRDIKKHYQSLATAAWAEVLHALCNDKTLPAKYKDHELKHNWNGYRDCHVKPDLVLIYRKKGHSLQLTRLGSHSELFK